MIHPLLHLIATKPQLLGDHVEAYAELVGAEVGKTSKMWISRVVFYAIALFLLSAGLIFAGVALMLWAVVPPDNMNSPWLLIVVPLVLFVGSVGRVYKMDLTGKILGAFGRSGRMPGTLDSIHQLACPDEKTLYLANLYASRLDKWVTE